MKDLEDFPLDAESDAEDAADDAAAGERAGDVLSDPSDLLADPAPPPEPRERAASPPLVAVAIVVAALALAAIAYFWFFGRTPPPPDIVPAAEPAPTVPRPTERVESEPIERVELPALDASDEVVRRLVGALSENPQLAAWLIDEDLVRRFVVAIDNLAEGVAPRPHLGALEPSGRFEVEPRGDRQVVSAAAFRRYDLATQVFTSLDTEGTVELYRELRPLIRQAYSELGYPNRDFEDTLRRALSLVVETPRPPREIEVVRGVKSYQYVDPALEGLPSAQKQLLRLGPDNLERIQAKASELLAALGGG